VSTLWVLTLGRERLAATPDRASVLERSDYRRGGASRQLREGWSASVAHGWIKESGRQRITEYGLLAGDHLLCPKRRLCGSNN